MTDNQWAPEPWTWHDGCGLLGTGQYIFVDCNEHVMLFDKEHLDRAVACVNACQGLPAECLERVQQGKSSIIVADEVLNGQRAHWQLSDSAKT